MAEKLSIEIFRKKQPEELTLSLAEPDSRTDIGSGAALTAAAAASYLKRAAALTMETEAGNERVEYIHRNSEILRGYMVHLIDEDVKSRGPLRKAIKENDPQVIEAARQPAAQVANEIVNMMNQLLELDEELCEFAAPEGRRFCAAAADLAMGSIRATMRYLFHQASKCSDETYRYVVKRENEITLDTCRASYARILEKTAE